MNMSRTQASTSQLKQNLCEYKYAPVNTWWGRVNMRRKQVNTSRHKCAPVNTSEHEWDKSKCNWWYPDNSLQPTKKTVISLSVSLCVSLSLSVSLSVSLSLSFSLSLCLSLSAFFPRKVWQLIIVLTLGDTRLKSQNILFPHLNNYGATMILCFSVQEKWLYLAIALNSKFRYQKVIGILFIKF